MVDTNPKKLVQVDDKVFKKLGAEAFLGVSNRYDKNRSPDNQSQSKLKSKKL